MFLNITTATTMFSNLIRQTAEIPAMFLRVFSLMQMFNTHSIIYSTVTADQAMLLRQRLTKRQGALKKYILL